MGKTVKLPNATAEQKAQAFIRQIQIEHKQVVLGVLYNSISAGAAPEPSLVDRAFDVADAYIKRCYPLPEEAEKTDGK